MPEDVSEAPSRSSYAIVALVLGLFAFFLLAASSGPISTVIGLIAIGFGIAALRRVNRGRATGRVMAVIGLIAGICGALGGLSSAPTATTTAPAMATATDNGADDSAPAPAATPTTISATRMGDDFERNQVAAEKKWGGQYVQFTATVTNINSSGVSFGNVTSQFSFTQISCHVKDENAVLDLAKGQPATVRGIVGGDQLLGVISLDECEVVSK
jgi:hypothetical protein